MQKTKTCVFCHNPVHDHKTGRTRAREHVFPVWLLNELNAQHDFIEFSTMEASHSDGVSLQSTEQKSFRKFDLNNFLLGAVCSTCNNGWMSQLEDAVKPTLGMLIKNTQTTIINPQEIAKWSLKTAYVLSCYLNPPIGRVLKMHGQGLVNRKAPLPKGVSVFHRQAADSRIWFSACQTFHIASSNPNGIRERYNNSYKFLIQVGHTQFLVQYYPSTNVRIGFDPAIATLLDANAETFKDTELELTPSNIQCPDFLFMMSNCIYEKDTSQLGRNDLCHCGSTLKLKHCHGATEDRREQPTAQNRL